MKTITDRIEELSSITPDRIKTNPPYPKVIKIELTGNCNFFCTCCKQHDNSKNKNMDFDLFKKISKESYECGIKEIGLFYMGESTIYPLLIEAISFVKKIGFEHIFLTTNGFNINEKLIFDMFSSGLNSLKFSVNYIDRKNCIDITGVDAYDTIINNIKMAHSVREINNFNTGIYASSIVFDNTSYANMEDTINKILPFIDEHYWLPLYRQICDDTIIDDVLKNNIAYVGDTKKYTVCSKLFCKTQITHDGLMSGCCFVNSDSFIFGDLKTQSFDECWNSSKYNTVRNKHIIGDLSGLPCSKCFERVL
jgi:MoaA/NifB/PqqE/SkfB family radical SAM enzyme